MLVLTIFTCKRVFLEVEWEEFSVHHHLSPQRDECWPVCIAWFVSWLQEAPTELIRARSSWCSSRRVFYRARLVHKELRTNEGLFYYAGLYFKALRSRGLDTAWGRLVVTLNRMLWRSPVVVWVLKFNLASHLCFFSFPSHWDLFYLGLGVFEGRGYLCYLENKRKTACWR